MSVFFCFVVLFVPLVAAFSFSPGTPTECDALPVTWTGGTPPFTIHLIPVFNVPQNISVPATAFKDGQGSFSIPQLPLAAGTQFMLTMSDSTGFGTGGTTDLLTPGASKGGKCSTAPPSLGFQFQLNDVLSQCKPYGFSAFNQAAQPVTIMGIIPSGTPFVLHPPPGANQFTWTANVKTGTSVVFMMVDALGRSGGSSKLQVAVNSDDNTCLTGSFPSSTSALPSTPKPTGTASRPPSTSTHAHPSSTSATSDDSHPGSTSGGAIAGTVIGTLLIFAVIASLAVFFFKKRRAAQAAKTTAPTTGFPSYGHNTNGYSLSSTANAAYAASATGPYTTAHSPQNPQHLQPQSYQPQPYQSQYPYGNHSYQPSTYTTNTYATENQGHNHSHTHSGAALGAYGNHEGSMLPYEANPFSDQPPQQYPPAQYAPPSTYDLPSANAYALPSPYENPFSPPMSTRGHPVPPPPPPPAQDPFASAEGSSTTDSMTSAHQRKAMMAGATSQPPRILQHTDAEDLLPPPNEDGVVELPPQYTERRRLAVVNDTSSPSPSQSPMPSQHSLPPPS